MLRILEVECPVPHQCQDPPRSAHHNVRTTVPFQRLLILLDAHPTKEYRDTNVVKVFAESLILFVDLKRQLSTSINRENKTRERLASTLVYLGLSLISNTTRGSIDSLWRDGVGVQYT